MVLYCPQWPAFYSRFALSLSRLRQFVISSHVVGQVCIQKQSTPHKWSMYIWGILQVSCYQAMTAIVLRLQRIRHQHCILPATSPFSLPYLPLVLVRSSQHQCQFAVVKAAILIIRHWLQRFWYSSSTASRHSCVSYCYNMYSNDSKYVIYLEFKLADICLIFLH
jgi:hypothetical protein